MSNAVLNQSPAGPEPGAAAPAPAPQPPAIAEFVSSLSGIVPDHCILTRTEDTRPFECDGLSLYRTTPPVVVLPENEEQVIAVLNACRQFNLPLVPRGAGTGLSGGALPIENCVLIGLSKFDQIKSIDPKSATAVVQPGVRNLAISEAAAPYGLYYAPDPSSQIACSIGGNIAENSGGVHCLKYGLTVHNVLRARVVTIDGEGVGIGSGVVGGSGYVAMSFVVGYWVS